MSYWIKYLLITIFLHLLIILTPLISVVHAEEQADVYFIYSQSCPHCKKQAPYMHYLAAENKNIKVEFLDINSDKSFWEKIKKDRGIEGNSVPRTITGNKVFIGFSDKNGPLEYSDTFNSYIGYYNQIISAIEAETGEHLIVMQKKQSWQRWLPLVLLVLLVVGYLHPMIRKGEPSIKRLWFGTLFALIVVSLFVLMSDVSGGRLGRYSSGIPFPVFVFIIAFLDGFNPCAFSVFIIFLSLLSHTAEKTYTALLGTVFIAVSSLMYFIFIIAFITAGSILYIAVGKFLFIVLGLGMSAAGVLNIKEYWFFKKGPSLTVSDSKITEIARKAGKITSMLRKDSSGAGALAAAVISTALLSVFVNMVEMGCTAILPAVYMSRLLNHYGNRILLTHLAYTLFYAAVYVIPLILLLAGFKIIFPTKKRLTAMQGRMMKLFSGILMLMLGLLLILRPEAVNF